MPKPAAARRTGVVSDDPKPASSRKPWGTLSREMIVQAALEAVANRPYQELTIRSLAADMGVAPMSLYNHVRDKNDLLDEVVDRLLARTWEPRVPRDDWRAWISRAADKLRRFLIAQPAALHIYLDHPVATPTALKRMDAMTAVLRSALDDETAAAKAYAAIHTYTIGFAALEASRSASRPLEEERPQVARLATFTSPENFAEGLSYLLSGIQHSASSSPG